jgi:predicted transcriptional regulator of viral defense system
MVNENNYIKLINSTQKFFSILDLSLIWDSDLNNTVKLASYYVKQGKLFKIKRGLFSILPFDRIEQSDLFVIGQKIITPSYITYHTALTKYGINFQYYKSIHLFAKYSKVITINLNNKVIYFVFHKISNDLLYLKKGLYEEQTANGSYYLTTIERTIIDTWFINPNLSLDHINNNKINKKLLKEIAQAYDLPRIWKNLKLYFNILK